MRDTKQYIITILLVAVLLPQMALAAWYNPFSWDIPGWFTQSIHLLVPADPQQTAAETTVATSSSQTELAAVADQKVEIDKLKKEVAELKKKTSAIPRDMTQEPTPSPSKVESSPPASPFIPMPVVESWASLENKTFAEASAKGWTNLTLTNSLGEKRYYRKEGAQWVQKNSEVEASEKYFDPEALKAFNTLMEGAIRHMTEAKRQEQQAAIEQQRRRIECTMEPTPPELRTLSPQQQQYVREQKCGSATPSSELNYKLHQEQLYQDCLATNPTNSQLSCDYIRPIFY